MRKIIVGSRKSNLALTQTKWVIEQLKKSGVENEFEIKEIMTKGDRILDRTLSKVGGKGLFIKEIEKAMYDKEIDFAVHSMKDMPSVMPEGLEITCVPVREDNRDAFISKNNETFEQLPAGSIIGTSSLRRAAQLQAARPDIKIQWIRGNIETRLRKLQEENFDAIILAASGVKRVGLSDDVVTEYLNPEICVPAIGQGALAIESREDDDEMRDILSKISDAYTTRTVAAERTFLRLLDGGCQVPIGGYAELGEDEVILTAFVGTPDGKTILRETIRGKEPETVGEEAAEKIISRGGKEIVEKAKEEYGQ